MEKPGSSRQPASPGLATSGPGAARPPPRSSGSQVFGWVTPPPTLSILSARLTAPEWFPDAGTPRPLCPPTRGRAIGAIREVIQALGKKPALASPGGTHHYNYHNNHCLSSSKGTDRALWRYTFWLKLFFPVLVPTTWLLLRSEQCLLPQASESRGNSWGLLEKAG